ncbi:MAG TPA: MaoC/PaaZ C-terminal domain-containing protein [Alphaproteobacteria bacterium]|nr:MaoC/PaaZ C-terminal domain-containing protein [Alphaproteobacteria bacterium]
MKHDLYFDDFSLGDRFATGGVTVTESAIIDFALQWDPQTYHVSREAAAAHPMGQIFASGFHTVSIMFRLFAQEGIIAKCTFAGGDLQVKWLKPVFAGDTIRCEFEVIELRAFKSRPGLGALKMSHTAYNQKDEVVVDCECTHIITKRPKAGGIITKRPEAGGIITKRPKTGGSITKRPKTGG